MKKIVFFATALLVLFACNPSGEGKKEITAANYHQAVKKLSDVMVHDIFSPPVASRNYVYPSIAAYEVLANSKIGYKSLAGQLNELTETPKPETDDYDYKLTAMIAFLEIAQQLVFSEDKMATFKDEFYKQAKKRVKKNTYTNSMEYGEKMAAHIKKWMDKDNYHETRTFPKYTVNTDDPGRWLPTPPDYMDGIEPHWNKIRTFVIDSAAQYKPERNPAFSMDKGSLFYKELVEVYEVGKKLNAEEEEIAQFWDCNPYVSTHKGHVMFAVKKITPGGHWIGITGQACRKANYDFNKTVYAYAKLSIALADAFISCWDEKYRSSLIRPETVINQHFDENWLPLLQTPPFPEYTSGHSVASASCAVALTDIFGDNFSFADSVEVEYGLPVRTYDSFYHAGDEAAISRLYGGIHYMAAIKNGVSQGKNVGNHVIQNLDMRE